MISFEVFTGGSGVSQGKFYQAIQKSNVHTAKAAYTVAPIFHALMQARNLINMQETLRWLKILSSLSL